jgi:hypothetical protein
LKNECVATFDRRYLKKDDIALKSFFDPRDETEEAYRLAISKCDTDKFRPLNTVLKKGRGKTDRKNIELLAWLIDFEPRPYATWLKDPVRKGGKTHQEDEHGEPGETVTVSPDISGDKEEIIKDEPNPPISAGQEIVKNNEPEATISSHKIRNALVLLSILILGGGAYLLWSQNPPPSAGTTKSDSSERGVVAKKSAACMYWNNDHYDTIPCNQTQGSSLIVPLDTFRLAHLRKVTDTSTVTLQSVGHLWYFKTGHSIECYTAGGAYPTDTNRRLRPITPYMIHKYFHR